MKFNREQFLKLCGFSGIGLFSSGFVRKYEHDFMRKGEDDNRDMLKDRESKVHEQKFNMCGFGAPPLDVVRTAHIGLGRGLTHLTSVSRLEGVEVKAICDLMPERIDRAIGRIEGSGFKPEIYDDGPESWKKMCERDDIDLVFIATPWEMHTPMAVYAMEQGKHVCIEVPAAVTIEECWQLVEVSESTRKHCMMLENCCYDFFELLTLNMARQGFFGEIVHGEGAYIHTLLELNFSKTGYWDMWRLRENGRRQGNLYPTHGLGPICQVMNINRGDKMEYLTAVNSKDFQMSDTAKELAATDEFYKEFQDLSYRGNMTTCSIRTQKGKSIMVQHDVTSPNVYSRIHKISGTVGAALKYPLPGKISVGHREWLNEEEFKAVEEKYTPEIVRRIGELARQIGGHGGMDFLMNWRLIDCLRNGLPLDQDVYDAALWSAIAPLTEWSVANRSNSIDVPDFTQGAWVTNEPVNLLLERGGNTKILRSNRNTQRSSSRTIEE